MAEKYAFIRSTSVLGASRSPIVVNLTISEKNTVATCFSPTEECCALSRSPTTIRGSTYCPNFSLIRSFSRKPSSIALKAWVTSPISSREVTLTWASSRKPAATARAPARRLTIGRVSPRDTRNASIMPTSVAKLIMAIVTFSAISWFSIVIRDSVSPKLLISMDMVSVCRKT